MEVCPLPLLHNLNKGVVLLSPGQGILSPRQGILSPEARGQEGEEAGNQAVLLERKKTYYKNI